MKLRNFLLCTIILSIMTLFAVPIISASNDFNKQYKTVIMNDSIYNEIDSVTILYYDRIERIDSLRNRLFNEVYAYIAKQSPSMAPVVTQHMVDIGLDKDFNICFMMAQAQLETNFGKLGSGQTRKSIFGVNGRYDTYEECIEKYVNLVQKNYLGGKKTEQHLLQNYVTIRGNYRYAGNENYEPELRNVYNYILAQTNIRDLQREINSL